MKFTARSIALIAIVLNTLSVTFQKEISSTGAFLSSKLKDDKNKKDKEIKSPFGPHSLFHEKDSNERMSFEYRAVPPPEKEKNDGKFPETEKIIARALVNSYRKIFDFLDYKRPINDCVSPDELTIVYSDFGWPMRNADLEPLDYSGQVIQQYDTAEKGCMNFVEFCNFMEGQWDVSDQVQMKNCGAAYDQAMSVWQRLFDWLDTDHDKWITQANMIYGLSKVMYRDVKMEEIAEVFKKYDPKNTQKINYQSFVLAIINGMLNISLQDNITPDIPSN